MNPILKVTGLTVTIEGKNIFEDLSFEIREGETLVILGPNGAGKTMLMKALLGLTPSKGLIQWRSDVTLGYVPQRVSFNRDLPVTVEDFFGLKGIEGESLHEILSRVGITDPSFSLKAMGVLSAGQFQRVLIAWALAKNPNVLIFDEPTAGVDIKGEEKITSLLERTKKERRLTILLVTHDLTTVYAHATHVLCLSPGMRCFGAPKEVLTPESLRQIYGGDVKFVVHNHD